MTTQFDPVRYTELLFRWQEVTRQLSDLKAKEMEMRQKLFSSAFAMPKEGVNNFELMPNLIVKGTYKLNRTVDKSTLGATLKQLPSGYEEALINWKPEVKVSAYKKLTDDQRLIFDQCLTIKPGSPTLAIVHKDKKQ